MKTRNLLVALLLGVIALQSFGKTGDGIRPKLVVGLVVDQMRWDYLYRFYDEYGEGGFKRMLNEGYSFENCQINYIPSITAIGHTSVYTGSVPSIHGIAGNDFMKDGHKVYCCSDDAVQTVGSDTRNGKASPCNLLTTTIGDELKTATNWQSKVIGVSYKDRAAILPAGSSADAAYWFDGQALRFISSTYYMNELPEWVNKYNKTIDSSKSRDDIQYSPYGNQIVEEMAKEAVGNEKLGQRGQTDMICVSFSCTDLTGHRYGTHHEKTHKMYVELDKQFADFFNYLDRTVGKGEWVAFLSADHGASNGILQNQAHKIKADGFYVDREEKALNEFLKQKYGVDNISKRIMDYKVVLNHEVVKQAGLDETEVKAAIVNYFKSRPGVLYAVDLDRAAEASIPSYIKEKIINGYNHARSGDVGIILQAGWYGVWGSIGEGTTHGCWNPYDCHIPFVLLGWGVNHGSSNREVHITDIAPTVCSLIHIQMPSGCIGQGVYE